MKRTDILLVIFAGALGYSLGMLLGILGIVIACGGVFALGMYLMKRELGKVNGSGNSSSGRSGSSKGGIGIGIGGYSNNPFEPLAGKRAKVRIKYRCLSCYTMHSRRECPKCGSKIKQVEF